jgi:hypothetical protein
MKVLRTRWMLRVAVVLGCGLLPQAALAGALAGTILDAGVSAVLEDVVQLPASGSSPNARINVLREAPDGSGRLFVNDLRGPLHVIDGGSTSLYLDMDVLRPDMKTSPGLASGFVSFTFDPDFANNGIFYTAHTEFVDTTPPTHVPAETATILHHAVLTEWTATNPAANAWAGTTRELIRIAAAHHSHNMGELSFDPNLSSGHPDYGQLYVSAGDYGSIHRNDPAQLQRLDTLFGAILRIVPSGGNGSPYSYGIPTDNPYVSDGDPDTFAEIYAHGTRNAHRLTWSRQGFGGPFISDIGELNLEEVNVLGNGRNYGWPEREGTYAIDVDTDKSSVFALPGNDATFGYTYPAAQYDHQDGRAIAGIVIDEANPASRLHGKLIFGDIVEGHIFYADAGSVVTADDGDPSTTANVFTLTLIHGGVEKTLLQVVRDELANQSLARADLRFGSDEAGTMYVMTKQDGFVRRLVPETVSGVPAMSGAAGGVLAMGLLAAAFWKLRRG